MDTYVGIMTVGKFGQFQKAKDGISVKLLGRCSNTNGELSLNEN